MPPPAFLNRLLVCVRMQNADMQFHDISVIGTEFSNQYLRVGRQVLELLNKN